MPVFGAYETSEEHSRSTRTTVWKGRGVAGRGGDIAVTVCNIEEWLDDSERAEAHLQAFGEAVGDLQKLTAAASRHWVEVEATSTKPGESWFVTRFYPRSLERVLDGRIPVDGPTLHWIVSSVIEGMRELEQVLQRPHGNLKAANIFIDNEGPLRGAPLLLADLKPRRELVAADARAADFQELGKIVVQLVRCRRYDSNSVIGWPLEAGPEWKRLGRHGEGWRQLCNRLLNPTAKPEDRDWAAIQRLMVPLALSRRPSWPVILGVGVPVCTVIGAVLCLRFTPYDKVPDRIKSWAEALGNSLPDSATIPPEWALYCGAYFDWFGKFLETADSPANIEAWSRDPFLKGRVIDAIAATVKHNGSFDPRKFDDRFKESSLTSLRDLPGSPTQLAEVARKGAVVRKVCEAYKTVEQIQKTLEEWPVRTRLSGVAERFDKFGWKQPAQELRQTALRAADPMLTAQAINEALAAASVAGQFEQFIQEMDRHHAALVATADPVLSELTAYYRERAAGAESLAALKQQLAEANQNLARLAALARTDWTSRIALDRFAKESFLRDYSGPVTGDVITRWETELQDYYIVSGSDDVRQAHKWTEMLRACGDVLATIAEEEIAPSVLAGNQQAASVRLRPQLDDMRRRVQELLAPSLVRKDLAMARQDSEDLAAALQRISGELDQVLLIVRPDPAAWLLKARAIHYGEEGSALAKDWRARSDQVLAGASASDLASDRVAYRGLRERHHRLEEFFNGLAAERGLANMPAYGVEISERNPEPPVTIKPPKTPTPRAPAEVKETPVVEVAIAGRATTFPEATKDMIGEYGEAYTQANWDAAPSKSRSSPDAIYPAEMRKRSIEGTVSLALWVDRNGTVRNWRVLKTSRPEFEKAAIDAVKQWKYAPGRKGKKSVAVIVEETIPFTITH
jgi:TonB family protein